MPRTAIVGSKATCLVRRWLTLACSGKQQVKRRLQTAQLRMRLARACLTVALVCLCNPASAQTELQKSRGSPPSDKAASKQSGTIDVRKTSRDEAIAATATATATADQQPATATAVRVYASGGRTIFELAVSRPVSPLVYVLSNPDRVIVDVADLDFALPPSAGQVEAGLVSAFRHGLVAAGRSRIVMDVSRPVHLTRSAFVAAVEGRPARLEIELEPAAAAWAPTAMPVAATAKEPAKPLAERKAGGKFVVMIDPGHGGIDGGAMGVGQLLEKDLVLAVARQLKAALDGRSRYDVRMTRSSDAFVSLDARIELSQVAGADLFISLHADSIGDPAAARTAHGATVYTLSETASNQAAQRVADTENAADAVGGLGGGGDADATQVNTILADLMKRETHNFSLRFKSLLVERLRPASLLARDPARAASFKVLRQTQTPTVLIELGFLSNETEALQMQTADWQKRMAGAIATAVDTFAARRLHAAQ